MINHGFQLRVPLLVSPVLLCLLPRHAGQAATRDAAASPWPQMRQRVEPKGSIAPSRIPDAIRPRDPNDRAIPAN
jgi:hypothetical protein